MTRPTTTFAIELLSLIRLNVKDNMRIVGAHCTPDGVTATIIDTGLDNQEYTLTITPLYKIHGEEESRVADVEMEQ